jgi:hypothetical protein
MSAEREIPTLPACRTSDGALAVWCDHCRRWHLYGGCDNTCTESRRAWGAKDHPVLQGEPCHCPPGVGDGHRVAHSHDPSRTTTRVALCKRSETLLWRSKAATR